MSLLFTIGYIMIIILHSECRQFIYNIANLNGLSSKKNADSLRIKRIHKPKFADVKDDKKGSNYFKKSVKVVAPVFEIHSKSKKVLVRDSERKFLLKSRSKNRLLNDRFYNGDFPEHHFVGLRHKRKRKAILFNKTNANDMSHRNNLSPLSMIRKPYFRVIIRFDENSQRSNYSHNNRVSAVISTKGNVERKAESNLKTKHTNNINFRQEKVKDILPLEKTAKFLVQDKILWNKNTVIPKTERFLLDKNPFNNFGKTMKYSKLSRRMSDEYKLDKAAGKFKLFNESVIEKQRQNMSNSKFHVHSNRKRFHHFIKKNVNNKLKKSYFKYLRAITTTKLILKSSHFRHAKTLNLNKKATHSDITNLKTLSQDKNKLNYLGTLRKNRKTKNRFVHSKVHTEKYSKILQDLKSSPNNEETGNRLLPTHTVKPNTLAPHTYIIFYPNPKNLSRIPNDMRIILNDEKKAIKPSFGSAYGGNQTINMVDKINYYSKNFAIQNLTDISSPFKNASWYLNIVCTLRICMWDGKTTNITFLHKHGWTIWNCTSLLQCSLIQDKSLKKFIYFIIAITGVLMVILLAGFLCYLHFKYHKSDGKKLHRTQSIEKLLVSSSNEYNEEFCLKHCGARLCLISSEPSIHKANPRIRKKTLSSENIHLYSRKEFRNKDERKTIDLQIYDFSKLSKRHERKNLSFKKSLSYPNICKIYSMPVLNRRLNHSKFIGCAGDYLAELIQEKDFKKEISDKEMNISDCSFDNSALLPSENYSYISHSQPTSCDEVSLSEALNADMHLDNAKFSLSDDESFVSYPHQYSNCSVRKASLKEMSVKIPEMADIKNPTNEKLKLDSFRISKENKLLMENSSSNVIQTSMTYPTLLIKNKINPRKSKSLENLKSKVNSSTTFQNIQIPLKSYSMGITKISKVNLYENITEVTSNLDNVLLTTYNHFKEESVPEADLVIAKKFRENNENLKNNFRNEENQFRYEYKNALLSTKLQASYEKSDICDNGIIKLCYSGDSCTINNEFQIRCDNMISEDFARSINCDKNEFKLRDLICNNDPSRDDKYYIESENNIIEYKIEDISKVNEIPYNDPQNNIYKYTQIFENNSRFVEKLPHLIINNDDELYSDCSITRSITESDCEEIESITEYSNLSCYPKNKIDFHNETTLNNNSNQWLKQISENQRQPEFVYVNSVLNERNGKYISPVYECDANEDYSSDDERLAPCVHSQNNLYFQKSEIFNDIYSTSGNEIKLCFDNANDERSSNKNQNAREEHVFVFDGSETYNFSSNSDSDADNEVASNTTCNDYGSKDILFGKNSGKKIPYIEGNSINCDMINDEFHKAELESENHLKHFISVCCKIGENEELKKNTNTFKKFNDNENIKLEGNENRNFLEYINANEENMLLSDNFQALCDKPLDRDNIISNNNIFSELLHLRNNKGSDIFYDKYLPSYEIYGTDEHNFYDKSDDEFQTSTLISERENSITSIECQEKEFPVKCKSTSPENHNQIMTNPSLSNYSFESKHLSHQQEEIDNEQRKFNLDRDGNKDFSENLSPREGFSFIPVSCPWRSTDTPPPFSNADPIRGLMSFCDQGIRSRSKNNKMEIDLSSNFHSRTKTEILLNKGRKKEKQ